MLGKLIRPTLFVGRCRNIELTRMADSVLANWTWEEFALNH